MTNDRESIWSVARGALKYYFAIFIPQVLLGLALATSLTVRQSDAENFLELWFAVWVSAAPFIVTAAGVSVTLTEIGRFVMVLAAWLQEHLEKARERRREEGRKERDRVWTEWYMRRMEAESRNEPFDEPPPSLDRNG